MKGLDISSWQKGINFDAISKSGIDFLIIRGGFTGRSTGTNYNVDKCFSDFYKQAKKYGIPVGCYWYSCANTREKGIKEAQYMYNHCLKGKQFEFPIYIDVEDNKYQVNNKRGVTDAIIGFCETLENLGYYVGIYGSDISGFKEKMYINELKAYDKWVARYGSKPKYVNDYGMHQTSSKGKIKGYWDYLDTDESFKDYENIIKKHKLNGFKELNSMLDLFTDEELAHKVWLGEFGNGKERREKLGKRWKSVQDLVNKGVGK